jgi:prevent-host-death family protein
LIGQGLPGNRAPLFWPHNLASVIEAARRGEPQIVTKHNRAVAVVVSIEEFTRLKALEGRSLPSFAEQLLALPQDDVAFERLAFEPRAVDP